MNTSINTDRNLIRQYLQGDEKAFELLINRHKDAVFTAIYLFVKERQPAEKIFMDTFLTAIEKINSGEFDYENEVFLKWIMAIAHKKCHEYFQRENKRATLKDAEAFDIFNIMRFAEENLEQHLERAKTQQREKQVINQLPPDLREIVILRHYANLTFKEIAELTRTTEQAVIEKMRYALQQIRESMEKQNEKVFVQIDIN